MLDLTLINRSILLMVCAIALTACGGGGEAEGSAITDNQNPPNNTASQTSEPMATTTPISTPVATSVTPMPAATSTPTPIATSTPRPTATSTPTPIATPTPTPTPTSTPTPVPEPTLTPAAPRDDILISIFDADAVLEGDEGITSISFNVQGSGPLPSQDIEVRYQVTGGNEDGLIGTVFISAAAPSAIITVTTEGDSIVEPDEQVSATLISTIVGALDDTRSTGMSFFINDDEISPIELALNTGNFLDAGVGNQEALTVITDALINTAAQRQPGQGVDNFIRGSTEQLIDDVRTLVDQYANNGLHVDLNDCQRNCADYEEQLGQPLSRLRSALRGLDQNNVRLFEDDSDRFWQLLVLWADAVRSMVDSYDAIVLDGNIDNARFIDAWIADNLVFVSRSGQPVPPDLGNYSRTDFSHVPPTSVNLQVESLQPFTSTGVYALPGQPVTVTRNDQHDATAQVVVSSLRAGATKEFTRYNRPKYLQTTRLPLAAGDSITFSSPYGGPVYIYSNTDHADLRLTFENVGQHPIVRLNEEMSVRRRNRATDAFYDAVIRNDYDWVDYVAPQYQIHSTRPYMVETLRRAVLDADGGDMSNGEWYTGTRYESGDGEFLYQSVTNYLYSDALSLAGLTGPMVEPIPEVYDFIEAQGWEQTERTFTQHSNHDQALCGVMCSGNPIDSNGFFRPPPQGVGEGHELGHGVEDREWITVFDGLGFHGLTNLYAEYGNALYKARIGEQLRSCGGHEWEALIYNEVRRSQLESDVFRLANIETYSSEDEGDRNNMGRLMFQQVLMAAHHQTDLNSGFSVQGRLQAYSRQLTRALRNLPAWEANQPSLGLEGFAWNEINYRRGPNAEHRNDIMLLALAVTTGYNFSPLFEMFNHEVSQDMQTHVNSMPLQMLDRAIYLPHQTDGICDGLESAIVVPVNNDMPPQISYARNPNGALSASSIREPWFGLEPENLMDGSVATPDLWQGFAPTEEEPAWVEYFNTHGRTVQEYVLSSANVQARDPSDWRLLGSNNGVNYDVLDTRSGETFAGRESTNPTYIIPVANRGSYRFYRLEITAIRGNNPGVAISEWALIDDSGPIAMGVSLDSVVKSSQALNFSAAALIAERSEQTAEISQDNALLACGHKQGDPGHTFGSVADLLNQNISSAAGNSTE